MPLVRAEIDIQHHGRTRPSSRLSCEECCTAARLLAQASSRNQQGVAIGNWRCQDIVDSEFNICAVLTIIGQWEAIRWLNAQHDRTGTPPRFGWGKSSF